MPGMTLMPCLEIASALNCNIKDLSWDWHCLEVSHCKLTLRLLVPWSMTLRTCPEIADALKYDRKDLSWDCHCLEVSHCKLTLRLPLPWCVTYQKTMLQFWRCLQTWAYFTGSAPPKQMR